MSAISNASANNALEEKGGKDENLLRLEEGLKQCAISLRAKPAGEMKRRSSSSIEDGVHDFNDYGRDSGSECGDSVLDAFAKGGHGYDTETEVAIPRKISSRDRFANKVLGRLNSRRAATAGLVFSRGHFLGDVSKMVARLLSSECQGDSVRDEDSSLNYGFGDTGEGNSMNDATDVSEMIIHESESDRLVVHSSTIAAGKDGCSVIVFPKSSLIPFLDEYPGLLLSLLGTQVVV